MALTEYFFFQSIREGKQRITLTISPALLIAFLLNVSASFLQSISLEPKQQRFYNAGKQPHEFVQGHNFTILTE